jgi:hypothetical protein
MSIASAAMAIAPERESLVETLGGNRRVLDQSQQNATRINGG